MVESTCFYWSRITDHLSSPPECFSLPATIPQWPQGRGFGTGRINLGELEVIKITKFDYIWGWGLSRDKNSSVGFYKPVGVPNGYFSLGHYCQTNNQPLHGFVLVAREAADISTTVDSPALQKPIDYMLVWSLDDGGEENYSGSGYFWKPQPPEGYKALGYLVTCNSTKPSLEEVSCVRADLTDSCETHRLILDTKSKFLKFQFRVWSTRPSHRGMHGKGVSVGTFFCSSFLTTEDNLCIACLKNSNLSLNSMPNLDQIRALINHYGPTVFFHPEEVYLPSSVSWFFENGALLYKASELIREAIGANGSNLPGGGSNDGEYWIDLPSDDQRERLKCGNLESAVLYVHAKPALGGTFTDIVMWVFCPFNGPVTLKLGILSISLGKLGQHVGDWEHFTLRISNFTGELWSIYFSQHSGGEWVDACDLEYIEGSKCIVYSSKSGHASFPHPGCYLQGSTKLGIGLRNDAAHSSLFVDSSVQYEIVAAEYLGDGVVPEPCWLQFMREWGPTIVYGSRIELDKIIGILPLVLRRCVSSLLNKLPVELYGEEGPTGPKEKNNWVGDERS